MVKRGNRGQLTIFIIIAILIVAILLFIFLFWPNLRSTTTESENPYTYIRECVEDNVEETIETLGIHGGVIENSAYFIYDREKVEYLCYTNKNYQPCVVQQPLLISNYENEFLNNIQEQINSCFESLESNYVAKGYEVDLVRKEPEVNLGHKKIEILFNARLLLEKGGDSQEYTNFDLAIPSNLYDMLSLASSIIQWERDYGEAPTSLFMDLYDYKIEKIVDIDGTHVYIITDKEHGDVFQFASRSLVRPPGVRLN